MLIHSSRHGGHSVILLHPSQLEIKAQHDIWLWRTHMCRIDTLSIMTSCWKVVVLFFISCRDLSNCSVCNYILAVRGFPFFPLHSWLLQWGAWHSFSLLSGKTLSRFNGAGTDSHSPDIIACHITMRSLSSSCVPPQTWLYCREWSISVSTHRAMLTEVRGNLHSLQQCLSGRPVLPCSGSIADNPSVTPSLWADSRPVAS